MKIINLKLIEDFQSNKPIKLDLGSGGKGKDGCYSIDLVELKGVDIVADLNKPLDDIPDNSTEYIYSRHALEHVNELLQLMKEIYRITKPGGKIEIIVPHYSNVFSYSDPTHVRFFGLYSMFYFVPEEFQPKRKVPAFYSDVRFKIEFYKYTIIDKIIRLLLTKIINSNIRLQEFYKRRLSNLIHAWQIKYIMTPLKN